MFNTWNTALQQNFRVLLIARYIYLYISTYTFTYIYIYIYTYIYIIGIIGNISMNEAEMDQTNQFGSIADFSEKI